MREIRFRAWRTDEKYMVTSDTGVLTVLRNCYGNKGLAEQARFSNIDNQPNPNKFILMQYTGLKDKTGKEIYEGDILDCSYINPMSKEVVKRLFEVVFKDGCFKAKCIGHSPYFVNEKGVVAGNIYENPELLKGE